MFKIVFFVPETHVEIVKKALFSAGAGTLGGYKDCSWQVLGMGQFIPLKNSHPTLGTKEQKNTVAEYKVETICDKSNLDAVVSALKKAHPYELPVIDVWQIMDL